MIYYTIYRWALGELTLCSDGKNIVELRFGRPTAFEPELFCEKDSLPVLKKGREWLDTYFQGKCPHVEDLPLKPAGTAFQQVVWKELGNVSYGEVTTYGKLARDVASAMGKTRMSAQAVGMALSKNPIAIMIPCHRVVGADGSLTGYAGGLEKKIALLNHEGGRI